MANKILNWRDDCSTSKNFYKRKFAWKRVTCADGARIWLKHYYKKYVIWGDSYNGKNIRDRPIAYYGHFDFVENISEEEFIIRTLAESL